MSAPSPRLCLGTVQFGTAYGVAGAGKVSPDEARAILSAAWDCGIRRLDTAPGYGDIEERLTELAGGRKFDIVTKIPAMPGSLEAEDAASFLITSLERSRARLGETICGVLFHAADDLLRPHGQAAWDAAARWCAAREVPLGLSVYGPNVLNRWTRDHSVAMAQLPVNAFDQRIADLRGAADPIELTARSAFLQGLLLMEEAQAARKLPAAAQLLGKWHALCRERNLSPVSAALGLVKGTRGLAFCAVGVENTRQLHQITDAWNGAPPLHAPELASRDPAVIDPRSWKVFP